MKNDINTLLEIKKYFPLTEEFQNILNHIELNLISSIRKDVKKTGTSPYLTAVAKNGDYIGHVAVKLNMNKLAVELLKYKNVYMKRNAEGKTMAFVALDEENIDVCLKILSKEDLILSSFHGKYFFMEATKKASKNKDFRKVVFEAIKHKRYLLATDKFGEHLGFYCVRNHLTRECNEIIANNPEIAIIKNTSGDTMGHIAYDEQNLNIISHWLENSTLRNTANSFGQTIPHLIASQNYKLNLLEPYLEDNNLMKIQDYLGNTIAHYLFKNNEIAYCHTLIQNKELLNLENKNKETIVDIAYHNGSLNSIMNYGDDNLEK